MLFGSLISECFVCVSQKLLLLLLNVSIFFVCNISFHLTFPTRKQKVRLATRKETQSTSNSMEPSKTVTRVVK